MMMTKNILRAAVLATILPTGMLFAQRGGPPSGGGMGRHEEPMGRDMMRPRDDQPPPRGEMGRPPESRIRTEPILTLDGRWWDNKKNAKLFQLRPEQVQHMDAVIAANRDSLLSLSSNLQREEQKFVDMPREDLRDEAKVFAQIDKIAQARAELEKAKFHTLLQIRAQLTSDQLLALDKLIADVTQP